MADWFTPSQSDTALNVLELLAMCYFSHGKFTILRFPKMGKPKYETWHLLDDFGGPPGNRNLQISREASNEKKRPWRASSEFTTTNDVYVCPFCCFLVWRLCIILTKSLKLVWWILVIITLQYCQTGTSTYSLKMNRRMALAASCAGIE